MSRDLASELLPIASRSVDGTPDGKASSFRWSAAVPADRRQRSVADVDNLRLIKALAR